MILTFRHKGLAKLFGTGSAAGVRAAHADRLSMILAMLNAATAPRDMSLPGLRVHPLKGSRSGAWSVSVSGNWRVTFRFHCQDVTDVDYEDYH